MIFPAGFIVELGNETLSVSTTLTVREPARKKTRFLALSFATTAVGLARESAKQRRVFTQRAVVLRACTFRGMQR